ncbi:S-layer homology domain-containing protein [uncultured Selenomonas sp.]|uniref:S-layer homology domain-containing protein n=1 Tax=uncultured Selenomonas sp. TaxID=159275 RepID=UPI0025DFA0E0|nr:S-layer homology domain-containing protein [uncultured Selenomonas sp.]
MEKTLVSALTTALVIGAASTTFAASNPFSDVPADHWAYDAVSQLAADGVITGYGDSTFQGNRNITRYEMAQMIAKAMAKKDVSAADKAMIDKLAAEFSDELNNLGVRVANLEKHADNVKWGGVLEYTYTSTRHDQANSNGKTKNNVDEYVFRLEPVAEVNDHWTVHARVDANGLMDTDGGNSDYNVKLKRAWAEGQYGKFNMKFGKLPNSINLISTTDDPYSGVELSYGSKWKVTTAFGRIDDSQFGDMGRGTNGWTESNPFTAFTDGDNHDTINYQGVKVAYQDKKFFGDVAYQHLDSTFNQYALPEAYYDGDLNNTDYKANIWSLKASYRFDKNSFLQAEYAKNTKADNFDNAYSFEYDYKGAENANKGSWGAYVAYRKLGQYAAPWSTYGDGVDGGQKGVELGVSWIPFKNILAVAKYFDGKDIAADKDASKLFGRFDFFF